MTQAVRESLRELADGLPAQATWDDVQYAIYVRRKVEHGLAAADQTVEHDQVKEAMRRWTDAPSAGRLPR